MISGEVDGQRKRSNDGAPDVIPPKKVKSECTCSICKAPKSTDEFSKSQRSKGDNAKCKECISAVQKATQATKAQHDATKADAKARHAANADAKAAKKAAKEALLRKNKEMEALEERPCDKCMIAKKKEMFYDYDLTLGEKAACIDCNQTSFREERRQSRLEEKVGNEEDVATNAYEEEKHYNEMKEAYNSYARDLKESSGRDIDMEMTTPSGLVYVVTSVKREGDQYSPHLHGIYTTCKKARESAKSVFHNVSDTYRDGNFIDSDERKARCDATEFLIPGVVSTSRVLFEVFFGHEDDTDYTAVGITAIPIDVSPIEIDLPFVQFKKAKHHYNDVRGKDGDKTAVVTEGMKVYAIFSYAPCGWGEEGDVNLCGIFTNREKAITRGKECASFQDEEAERDQIDNAVNVSNGKLFYDEDDYPFAIALETVTLDDQEYGGKEGKEVECGCIGTNVWMKPMVDFY